MTLYAERDPEELEPYFSRHMSAMTGENLHSKTAIALELAHRDSFIFCLAQKLNAVLGLNEHELSELEKLGATIER